MQKRLCYVLWFDSYLFLSADKIPEEVNIDRFKLRKIGTALERQELPNFSLTFVASSKLLDIDLLLRWFNDLFLLDMLIGFHIQ